MKIINIYLIGDKTKQNYISHTKIYTEAEIHDMVEQCKEILERRKKEKTQIPTYIYEMDKITQLMVEEFGFEWLRIDVKYSSNE